MGLCFIGRLERFDGCSEVFGGRRSGGGGGLVGGCRAGGFRGRLCGFCGDGGVVVRIFVGFFFRIVF